MFIASLHLNLKYLGVGVIYSRFSSSNHCYLQLSHSIAASLSRLSCVISGHWIKEGYFTLPKLRAPQQCYLLSHMETLSESYYPHHPVMLRKLGP